MDVSTLNITTPSLVPLLLEDARIAFFSGASELKNAFHRYSEHFFVHCARIHNILTCEYIE